MGSGPSVVELRQYSLVPGKRDVLIDLFEANFVESQEACGMTIIGTFRDLDNDDRFVWLRGFDDMDTRARSLADFYYGPVWKRHRSAANSTMIDSDDVLLLRPARDEYGFHLDASRPPGDGGAGSERGLVEVTVINLTRQPQEQELAYLDNEVVPRARTAGSLLACLVSENSANTFPALPVREDEHVVSWLVAYPDQTSYHGAVDARSRLERAAAEIPNLAAPAQVLRLSPTRRSLLSGSVHRA